MSESAYQRVVEAIDDYVAELFPGGTTISLVVGMEIFFPADDYFRFQYITGPDTVSPAATIGLTHMLAETINLDTKYRSQDHAEED